MHVFQVEGKRTYYSGTGRNQDVHIEGVLTFKNGQIGKIDATFFSPFRTHPDPSAIDELKKLLAVKDFSELKSRKISFVIEP
ncbi:hypothetical protein HYX07_02585 [Candidatus Woesearchaeota archaeon]|nr:hypothetical protein [Candidatus Woesearchaeota archaeon]